jgi:hypothetical protein
MTDQNKSIIISLSISFIGLTLAILLSEYVKYSLSIFFCFPLGLDFLLRKKVYFSFAGELTIAWKCIIGFTFIWLGIYNILYANNIVR